MVFQTHRRSETSQSARRETRGFRRSRFSGFTIVELLVSIAIIGLLIAITLPAIQSSREAARKMDCSNRLRQIGIAIESYSSNWGYFPNGLTWKYELLPFIDQRGVYDAGWPESPNVTQNTCNLVLESYLCPSDAASSLVTGTGSANYAVCYGSGVLDFGYNGIFSIWEYDQPDPYTANPTRHADVTDGLSNTTSVSEILRQIGHADSILRATYSTPMGYGVGEGETLARVCDSIPSPPSAYGWDAITIGGRGTPWYEGNYGKGQYNHMLPPNRPSCNNSTNLATGVHTAASMHAGGVHVGFADGHVAFVSNSVDSTLWRELGSRASGKPANF